MVVAIVFTVFVFPFLFYHRIYQGLYNVFYMFLQWFIHCYLMALRVVFYKVFPGVVLNDEAVQSMSIVFFRWFVVFRVFKAAVGGCK